MPQLLTYSKNEKTVINEGGKEVCESTKCLSLPIDKIIDTYTRVVGGDWAANANKLAVSGYESYINEKEKEGRPASGLQWQSENTSTMIVNLRLLDEFEEQLEKLSIDSST